MRHPRAVPAAAAIIAIASLLIALIGVDVLQTGRLDAVRSDFAATQVGATLLTQGHRTDLYDEQLQAVVHSRLIAPVNEGLLPFVNPPTAALVAAPLTALDLLTAYRVAVLLQAALLVAAVVVALRSCDWPPGLARTTSLAVGLAAVAGPGTLNLVLLGQWDGLCALGVALAYAAWKRERRGLAGLLLAVGIGLAKPHLGLGIAALVVGRRDPRLLIGAVAGAGLLVAADLAIAGPAGCVAFLQDTVSGTTRWPLRTLLGFTGLTGSWLGDGAAAQVVAAAMSAVALAACIRLGAAWRTGEEWCEPALAGALALGLVATPHLLGHDLVLLAPAMVWCVAWAARRDAVAAGSRAAQRSRQTRIQPGAPVRWPGPAGLRVLGLWILLTLVARIDVASPAMAPPGRLVPWVLAGSGVAALAICGVTIPGVGRRQRGVAAAPTVIGVRR